MILIAVVAVAALDGAGPQPLAGTPPDPQGLWLHAAAGAGVVGRDGVVLLEPGLGLETQPFAVHLSLPLMLRVIDLPPAVDPASPSACRVVRCEEWLVGSTLSAESLSKVVDEVRVFHAGDVFHLQGGALFASLGHGALVDEYTNAADWDRRHAGLYAESNLPWGKTQLQALTGDFLAPHELFGARVSTSPLAGAGEDGADDDEPWARLSSRLRLGFEAAGDLVAPLDPADAHGDVVPGARSRPVGGVAADVTWPLFDDGSAFGIAPYAGVSAMTGLQHSGAAGVGGGAQAGLDVSLDVVFVALRGGAHVLLDGPRHRSGVLDTLYDVDRKRYALAESSAGAAAGAFADDGIANLDAAGGVGADVNVELLVLRVVRAGARFHADPVAAATRAEVFASVDAGAVRVDARAIERAFALGSQTGAAAFAFGDRSFVVLDAAWQVWAPLSLFVRWLHGPRFVGGLPHADDDVVAGASLDVVLSPG